MMSQYGPGAKISHSTDSSVQCPRSAVARIDVQGDYSSRAWGQPTGPITTNYTATGCHHQLWWQPQPGTIGISVPLLGYKNNYLNPWAPRAPSAEPAQRQCPTIDNLASQHHSHSSQHLGIVDTARITGSENIFNLENIFTISCCHNNNITAALWKQNQLIAKLPSCSPALGAVPGYHFLTLNVINFSIYILSLCCHGWNTFVRFATWNTKAIKVQIFLIPAGQKKILTLLVEYLNF